MRDGAFEVIFGEFLNPGKFRLVYFSAGGKDILGYSGVVTIRNRVRGETPPDRAVEIDYTTDRRRR